MLIEVMDVQGIREKVKKGKYMKRCYFCKGRIVGQEVRVDFRWGDDLVVIEDVPAEVCQQCGEKYLRPGVYKAMENLAKTRAKQIKRVAIDVIRFVEPVVV